MPFQVSLEFCPFFVRCTPFPKESHHTTKYFPLLKKHVKFARDVHLIYKETKKIKIIKSFCSSQTGIILISDVDTGQQNRIMEMTHMVPCQSDNGDGQKSNKHINYRTYLTVAAFVFSGACFWSNLRRRTTRF